MATTMRIDARTDQCAARQRQVDEAIHSGEMEGLSVTAATRSDMSAYVEGQIGSEDLVERVRGRYGLA